MNLETIANNVVNVGFPIALLAMIIYIQYKIKETKNFDYHK